MGRGWYEQGKMLNKKNTFSDFIAAAEHLVQEKYTSPDRLAARGGSAGGLLMGAVVMRPDLFKVVVADVPFVDVVTTMLDASIPLTTGEWLEWGDPRKPEFYAYMKSYSPYGQRRGKGIPHHAGHDRIERSAVAFWEPAKWVARLRATKTGDNPLLLKTNMGAGHGGCLGTLRQFARAGVSLCLHPESSRHAGVIPLLLRSCEPSPRRCAPPLSHLWERDSRACEAG